jgi:hypothetical protein
MLRLSYNHRSIVYDFLSPKDKVALASVCRVLRTEVLALQLPFVRLSTAL